MVELLLVGSLTRDVTVLRRAGAGAPLRWTQPGGAPWHGGLALQADPPAGTADPSPRAAAVAQAGPWGRRFALPALAAFGVRWLGPESAEDTVFRNRSAGGRRQQTLLARARPLRPADLPAERPGGVVVSPLFPEDVGAGVVERLRAAGPFLGLDLQGWLRAVDAEGRVRARRLGGIEAIRAVAAGAQVVKFSAREFQRLGPTDDWREAARAAAGALGAEVLVTRGAAGAFLATPGGAVAEAGGVRGGCSTAAAPATYFWPPTCGRAVAGPGRWRRWRRRRGWRSGCCGGGPTGRPVCRWPI